MVVFSYLISLLKMDPRKGSLIQYGWGTLGVHRHGRVLCWVFLIILLHFVLKDISKISFAYYLIVVRSAAIQSEVVEVSADETMSPMKMLLKLKLELAKKKQRQP